MNTTGLTPEQTARIVAARLNNDSDPVIQAFLKMKSIYGFYDKTQTKLLFQACEVHHGLYHEKIEQPHHSLENELFALLCKKYIFMAIQPTSKYLNIQTGEFSSEYWPEMRFLDDAIDRIKNQIIAAPLY